MKKKLLIILSLMLVSIQVSSVRAKDFTSNELSSAINLYKSGNYAQCYTLLNDIIESDTANALAYYYLAISSVQVGKKAEAIENYEKVLTLTPENNNLRRYAEKGKRCLETPEKCEANLVNGVSEEFILNKFAPKSSKSVQKEYENLKIQNLMREINRSIELTPDKFKGYRDFSSMQSLPLISILNSIQDSEDIDSTLEELPITENGDINSQLIKMLLTNSVSQSF